MIFALKKPSTVIVPALVMLILSPLATFAQRTGDSDALIVMVNLERIRAQLQLADQSLAAGDGEMAFEHAFIPHTTTFPSIKIQLKEVDIQSATRLESLLTDLPVSIKSEDQSAIESRQSIAQI